jgi:hypothetical protein
MKVKTLIGVNAIAAVVFGVAFACFPGSMMSAYGVTQVPEGWAFARLLGVTLISFGLVLWSVRGAAMSVARQSITGTLLSANLIGLVLMLIQQRAIWSIGHNLAGWITVGMYLCFVAAYGCVWLTKPLAAQPA